MSLVHRLLQRFMGLTARVVCAIPGLVVGTALVLTLASIWIVATRFNVINNTTDLLSDDLVPKQNYNTLLKEFGSDYRFIVLIQSPDVAKNREVADEVGKYLETLKPRIGTVLSKIDFSSIKQRLLFTREPKELADIAAQLEDQAKSAAGTQKIAFDLNSILHEADQKFSDSYLRKSENWKDFTPFVAQFVSILNKVADQAEDKPPAAPKPGAQGNAGLDDFDADEMLAQNEYFSLQGGKAILVMAYSDQEEKDSDAPFSNTVEVIRKHLKEMEAQHPGIEIKVTGEPVLDADQIAMSKWDMLKASGITVLLILLLFGISYKTLLRPLFAFSVLIMAVMWSIGFALVAVGHFNVISIAVLPMILGIGIDFGIQVLGRYEEELGHGLTPPDAVAETLKHTGVAIITGGSTTAAAFFTLCFNGYVGLSELGIIAGFGMILCIAGGLLVLPAIFLLCDRSRPPELLKVQSSNTAWNFIRDWDHVLVRTPWRWIFISILISAASVVSLPYLKFDYNLLHLQSPSAESVQVLYQVMDDSKSDSGNEISTIYASVVADNIDQARELEKKLMALPEVAKVDSCLELIPENQEQKKPIIKRIVAAASTLNLDTESAAKLDIPQARKDIAELLDKARQAEEQAEKFVSVSKIAKEAVEAFGTMVPALERVEHALNAASAEELKKRFESSSGAFNRMKKNILLLKSQKADRGLEISDIPPQLQRIFLSPHGKFLLQVYGKQDLWEHEPDAAFSKAVLRVAPTATGTPILNHFATDLLVKSYLWAAIWAFLAIVILIFLHFQSLKYLLLTITPLILAVLWRTGAMVWLGIEFNPANIITLPLIIGIDVAFGVYIVDRYREEGKLLVFSGSTGKAIIMSSLTSLFGFASLLIAQFRGVYTMGLLMSLGLAIGLVTSIFVLPQFLALLTPERRRHAPPPR